MPRNSEVKTISLEYNLTTHQIIHTSIFTVISAILTWKFLFGYFYQIDFIKGIGALIIFILLLIFTLSKKGLVKDDTRLYKGIFIFHHILLIRLTFIFSIKNIQRKIY